MDPVIYNKIDEILEGISKKGVQSVLEVGAIPSDDALLSSVHLSQASNKVGINLDGPHEYKDFIIHKGNSNNMAQFEDESFDLVLCNAVLEHDPHFYKSLMEMKRVLKKGGYLVIGVPGFNVLRNESLNEKFKKLLRAIPFLQKVFGRKLLGALFNSTLTFKIHDYPGGYYRFSPQCIREVFFDGLDNVEICSLMTPPRLIGVGTKA